MFKFEILKKSKKSKARLAKIKTPHGEIMTPAFLPVATLGVIKTGLIPQEIAQTKIQAQIVNSFHFLDLNQVEIVAKKGGLHQFFNFNKPIFTDSGGFQIFSLGKGAQFGLGKIRSIFPEKNPEIKNQKKNLIRKIREQGVSFISPRDGREIFLSPEKSAQIQIKLGADFIYCLDICGSPLDNYQTTKKEMERSHNWFKRFLNQKIPEKQRVFAIIQGGLFKDLRENSTQFVNDLPVFGIAIGGALGKKKKEMFKILGWINKKIDQNKPHHLLGIGDLEVLEEIIKSGIDLFDCALPTRIARHGTALTKKGYLDIVQNKLSNSFKPIERNCQCPTCQNYTIAQINFLFKAKESLAGRLLTIHNLFFLENQLAKIREQIKRGKF